MKTDIVSAKQSKELENFAQKLGFDKLIYTLNNYKILQGGDELKVRNELEKKTFDFLLNPHLVPKKDHLHFRRGGINQVICKILNKKKISIAFSFNKIQTPEQIGRIKQNIKLCRKYKVKIKIFTLAKNKYELRSYQDLFSFCKVLGMTGKEAKKAFEE